MGGWRGAGELDMGCRGKGGGDRRDWARQVMGTGGQGEQWGTVLLSSKI